MSSVSDVNTWKEMGLMPESEKSVSKDLDQDAFLKLMVAQINNQDPTEPMDSAQFLSQLSQFATVGSLQKLQTSFGTFTESLRTSQALAATSLLGKSVMAPGDVGTLMDASGVVGAVDVPGGATDVGVNVYNSAGALVRRMPLADAGTGLADFHWDGLDADGNAMTPGSYRIKADGLVDGRRQSLETLIVAPIESVTLGAEGGETVVNLRGLGAMGLSDVRQIM